MSLRLPEASFAASAVFMSTPGGYPPSDPSYQVPPPGYVPPPTGQPAGGLSTNAAAALSYLFGLITGIIFLVLEPYKQSPFVRFNAFQSIFLNLGYALLLFVWTVVAGLLDAVVHAFIFVHLLISGLLGLGFLIVWILLMVRASQGRKWVLPVIGPFAEKQAGPAY